MVAPAAETVWYREWWLLVGAGFTLVMALVLYVVVTRPIVKALRQQRRWHG